MTPSPIPTAGRKLSRAALRMAFAGLLAAAALAPLGAHAASAPVPVPAERAKARAAIEAQILRLSELSGGEVGVMARHLETGLTVASKSRDHFPMASTFKIAVAGAVLAQVDAKRLSLDQMVPVDPALIVPSEGIAEVFPFPGISLSVRNLIETMMTKSDNTATDLLTRLAGGPGAVTAWVRSVGVEDLRVDGDTAGIIGRFYMVPPGEAVVPYVTKALAADPGLEDRASAPDAKYGDDPRDTTTPEAMVKLLSRIVDDHVLSAGSTDVLLGAMERCSTGPKRIKGMLPAATVVKHKTGTLGASVNDTGVIYLPGGAGRVAIAVYVKKSKLPEEARERAIAEISRSIYDYMLIESASR